MQAYRNHGDSTVHSGARCGREEGLAMVIEVLDYCPLGEWSKQMLIGCLGTGNTKARQLPDKDSQKDALPEVLATNVT